MKRLIEGFQAVVNVTAIERTATTAIKGAAQAVNDCEEVVALVNLSAIGVAVTLNVKLQESDTTTDGDFADISAAAIVALGAADDDKVAPISVRPSKKYLRAVLTPGGTVANGVTAGVNFLLKKLGNVPTVNTPPAVVV